MAEYTHTSSRVLITGATGFVGGHIAETLFRAGRALRVLMRPTSRVDRLPSIIQEAVAQKAVAQNAVAQNAVAQNAVAQNAASSGDGRVELYVGDLSDADSLRGIFEGVDGLVHCACAVKGTFDESRASRAIFHQVNVDGTLNLAALAADAGVRMVHLSSTAAMGPVPDSLVDETTECVPAAPYQRSKRQAELRLLQLHHDHDLDVVILRPCLILGPGKNGGEPLKLFKLVQRGIFPKIGGSMRQIKPLIDVRDVAQACQAALDRGQAGHIYLIHSDGDHRLDEILEVCRHLVGASRSGIYLPKFPVRQAARAFESLGRIFPTFNPPLTPARLDLFLTDRRISIARARQQLGFYPHYQDLYEMLGRTYVGYVRDGQLNS